MLSMILLWLGGVVGSDDAGVVKATPSAATSIAEAPTATARTQGGQLAAEGWRLFQEQKLPEALAKFKESVALNPLDPDAWNGLGWAQFNTGASAEALVAFERCTALSPNHPAGLNGLGQVRFMWKEYDAAEKALLKAAPQADAAWFGLAKLYLLQGEFAKARPWVTKIARSNPDLPIASEFVAAVKQEKLGDALRAQIEPPGKPQNANKLASKGWQLFNQGNQQGAEEAFREAFQQDGDDLSAANGLAFCLLNRGETSQARTLFEKCLQADPKAAGPLNGLARCLKAEGKTDEAIGVWNRMAAAAEGASAANSGLGATYFERGEYALAIEQYEILVKSAPDNAYFQERLEAARRAAKTTE
ncbi:MAG: tetratricopeptide repeat protein [Planctomycetales bacterium]|nr:tetratricopeptide repeat protein [Planctomycetales bacterium]